MTHTESKPPTASTGSDAGGRSAGEKLALLLTHSKEDLRIALDANRMCPSFMLIQRAVKVYNAERDRLLKLFLSREQQLKRARMKPRLRDKHVASLLHAANCKRHTHLPTTPLSVVLVDMSLP